MLRSSLKSLSRGFSLVQLMISVVILGVILFMSLYAAKRMNLILSDEEKKLAVLEAHKQWTTLLRTDISQSIKVTSLDAFATGITRSPNEPRTANNTPDTLQIVTGLYSEYTAAVKLSSTGALIWDLTPPSNQTEASRLAQTRDLFLTAFASDSPRRAGLVQLTTTDKTTIIEVDTFAVDSATNRGIFTPRYSPGDPNDQIEDAEFGQDRLINLNLAQLLFYSVNPKGEMVRTLALRMSSPQAPLVLETKILAQNIASHNFNFMFAANRDALTVINSATAVSHPEDISACPPASPNIICPPSYEDLTKVNLSVAYRNPVDSSAAALVFFEAFSPYGYDMGFDEGSSGQDLSCDVKNINNRCSERCNSVFTSGSRSDLNWVGYKTTEPYCQCAVRDSNGRLLDPGTPEGKFEIAQQAQCTGPNGCSWINTEYRNWPEGQQKQAFRNRIAACSQVFNLCDWNSVFWHASPEVKVACDCMFEGSDIYNSQAPSPTDRRFNSHALQGYLTRLLTASPSSDEIRRLSCRSWTSCGHWANSATNSDSYNQWSTICSCRTRDVHRDSNGNLISSEDLFDNLLDFRRLCNLDANGAPLPTTNPACPETIDSATGNYKRISSSKAEGYQQGLTDAQAGVCACLRSPNGRQTPDGGGWFPLFGFNFGDPATRLPSTVIDSLPSDVRTTLNTGGNATSATYNSGAYTMTHTNPDGTPSQTTITMQSQSCGALQCEASFRSRGCCQALRDPSAPLVGTQFSEFSGYCHERCWGWGMLQHGADNMVRKIVTGRTPVDGSASNLVVGCGGNQPPNSTPSLPAD